MKISPINLSCFKSASLSVNKIQTNVFKNNEADSVSFTGVRENREGKVFSYEKETRKPSSYGSKKLAEITKDVLSEIDKKTNKLIEKTNKISKRADKLKQSVAELFDSHDSEAIEGKRIISTIKKDYTYLLGVLEEDTGDVIYIKTSKVKNKKGAVVNTYSFNACGQLESYTSKHDEKTSKIDLKPDEIIYSSITGSKEKKKTAHIKFGKDDAILYARFSNEKLSYDVSKQKNGQLAYEEEMKYEKKSKDGKKTSVVKKENKRKHVENTVQY